MLSFHNQLDLAVQPIQNTEKITQAVFEVFFLLSKHGKGHCGKNVVVVKSEETIKVPNVARHVNIKDQFQD